MRAPDLPLSRPRGFSLVEIAIAVGVVAVLVTVVAPAFHGRRNHALAEQTVRDAEAIAEAAVGYYWRTGRWPATVEDLGDIPSALTVGNRFGFPYRLAGVGRRVLVTTTVPLRALPTAPGPAVSVVTVGGRSEVTVARTLPVEGLAGALYDKRHLYCDPNPNCPRE